MRGDISFIYSQDESVESVFHHLSEQVKKKASRGVLKGLLLYSTVIENPGVLVDLTNTFFKHTPVLGASSCLGFASQAGHHKTPVSIGGLAFFGEDVEISTALVPKDPKNMVNTGKLLIEKGISNASFQKDDIRFVILHPTPGEEEDLLKGIFQVLPTHVPFIGGSAGDNSITGEWFIWNNFQWTRDGVGVLMGKWPGEIQVAFQSGYLPAGKSGTVTQAEGRIIYSIDNRPAAEVYNEWIDGKISKYLEQEGVILNETTLYPLGIEKGKLGGVPAYILIHPERVILPEKALSTFARIDTGQHVKLMSSTPLALEKRAGNVAKWALMRTSQPVEKLSGALLIYCAGCMLTIQDRVEKIISHLTDETGNIPIVAAFTFGEQGCPIPKEVDHANLMCSLMLWYRS